MCKKTGKHGLEGVTPSSSYWFPQQRGEEGAGESDIYS